MTPQISSTDVPGHDKFIASTVGSMDWRQPHNDNLWQGVDGINNPCPPGWRLPTENELNAERMSWSTNGSDGAFDSPLKWAEGGSRMTGGGLLPGHFGVIWSSTISGTRAKYLYYYDGNTHMFEDVRASGYRVRCVKDTE